MAGGGRFRDSDVRLGRVAGVFGLRGEVRLFVYNRDSDFLAEPRDVVLVGPEGERRAARLSTRPGAGRRVLGRLDGVADPEAARALMGWEIVVDRAALPPAEEGSWYRHDLLGLEVRDPEGRALGRLAEIHDTAEVEVWVIRAGRRRLYLPLLRDTVRKVDLDAGTIEVLADRLAEDGP